MQLVNEMITQLDYPFFKDDYEMIAIDLSKKKKKKKKKTFQNFRKGLSEYCGCFPQFLML